MSQKFYSEVTLETLNNATTDTDRFLVGDSGTIKYRTGSQLLSDLGVSGLYVPYTGATGNVDLGTHTLSSYNLIVNHTSGSGVAASITKGGSGEALTINKTSGSGNAMSVTGGLTSLVNLTLSSIANATIDTDRFIVSDGGAIKYRTGAQLLSDIGAQPAGGIAFNDLIDKSGGTGTYQTSGDFRAPAFYDSNNTAYYLDAAGTSNLASTYIAGHYYGTSNASNILIRTAANSSEMGIVGQNSSGAFRFQLYGDVGSYGFLNSEWGGWDLRKGTNSNLYLNNQSSYYYGTDTAYLYRVWGIGDMRSPIYYDLDNTAYYVDPNNTSNIYRLTMSERITLGVFPSSTVNTGEAWIGRASDRLTGTMTVQLGGNSPSSRFFEVVDYAWSDVLFSTSSTGISTASASFRAPIFYDSNNTSYYLDPAGNTAIRTVGSWRADSSPWDGEFAGKIQYHDDSWYFQGGNRFIFRTPGGSEPFTVGQSGSAVATGDMRAPIFYDSNNSGYYMDPASTSNVSAIVANNTIRSSKAQADNNYTTAAIWTESYNTTTTGVAFHISGTVGKFLEMRTNGILYWDNAPVVTTSTISVTFDSLISKTGGTGTYQTSGDFRAPIFYDSNDTNYYIDPTGSSNINIITAGEYYAGGWFRNNTANTGLYNQANGNHIYSRGGTRWGITGNSSSADIYLDFYANHQTTYRGSVHADSVSSMGFLTNDGGWGLRVETNKNVHVHGTTLYISADGQNSSNIIMRDGDEGDRQIHCNSNRIGFLTAGGGWGSWCEDNGAWSTQTSMYSPIYYDYDNTAYYIDPSATSNLNGLLVGGLNVVKTWQTISGNIDNNYGEGFVTFDPIPAGTPPLASPNIRTINVGEDFDRRTQLAFDYESDLAYFRRRTAGGWHTWRQFIHSGNIGSQSVSYATDAGYAS